MNDEIKLGRVGHYSVPKHLGQTEKVCWTASICKVYGEGESVNVAGFSELGNPFARSSIRVGTFGDSEPEFHLNRDCPDQR